MSRQGWQRRRNQRRCSTESHREDRHIQTHKYSLLRIKRSEPLNPVEFGSLKLPDIKYTHMDSTCQSKRLRKSSIRQSREAFLPDCLLIIKEEGPKIPNRLSQLLEEFNIRHKSLPFVAQLSVELQQTNGLFRKLSQLVSCCILRNSTKREYQKGSYVYSRGDESKSFFIILTGKILLYHKKQLFRKVCKPGQTISEQIIAKHEAQELTGPSERLQFAKALERSVLLQVKASLYRQLCTEFHSRGQKYDIQTLESLVMRNFLTKTSIRKARFF